MKTTITEIDHNTYSVNGKTIFRDTNGNWIDLHNELTPRERKAFHQHINRQKLSFKYRKN